MHRLLYRQGLALQDARAGIAALASETPAAADDIELMDRFLDSSTRGIVR